MVAQRGCHLEGIRPMSVHGEGDPKTTRSEQGFQTCEGVCEPVRVPQGAIEEVMLGFSGQGGSEAKGPGCDGSRSADGVEVGVKNAEEGARVAGRFREEQFAAVEVSVIEGEGEPDGDGGALEGAETGAEGVEATTEDEEERFESFERMFQFAGHGEFPGWALQGEEAVVLPVQDIVGLGCLRAEPFPESLARKGGKAPESLDAPEAKEISVQVYMFRLQRGDREAGNVLNAGKGMLHVLEHRFRMEGERGPQELTVTGQQGEIRGRSEGDMERKAK